MSRDRIIIWKDKRPSKDDVGLVLEDYFHGLASSVGWSTPGNRYIVDLVGKPSYALQRIQGVTPRTAEYYAKERFMEVVVSDGVLDVLTRSADEATNALADGLVQVLALHWDGDLGELV